MNPTEIAHIRLASQQIKNTKIDSVKELVSWMGAMQAQDYYMSKWAVGIRIPDTTDKDVETVMNNGEVLRTHLLRPTWHLVSADDVHWMRELTAPQIKSLLKSRHKELELTEAILSKSNSIIEKALSYGDHLTREELMAELGKLNIITNENRSSHFLLVAELNGIVCSGISRGKKQTYALLHERAPMTKPLNRDEALARLAQRYFTSHCPATLQDFVWWSGLSVADARHGLEMVKSHFISETVGKSIYWLTNSFSLPNMGKTPVFLLPAYDEFIISYRDRSASLPAENQKHAISENGLFRPVIVIDGKVTGLWSRTTKKDKVLLETKFFQLHDERQQRAIEEASKAFGRFLDKKVEISWS
jgi:hypothetical protein